MSSGLVPRIGEVRPPDAWDILRETPTAVLIDVRTSVEWAFVGVPDLSELGKDTAFIEWARYPDMHPNPTFVADVTDRIGARPTGPVMFLCRSGVRSLRAAQAVGDALARDGTSVVCLNVAEGFEGDLDENRHRGVSRGWKAHGLAWRQT